MLSKNNVVEFCGATSNAISDNSLTFRISNDVQSEKITFLLDNVFDFQDPFVKYLQATRKKI